MQDIEKISTNLNLGEDGIWHSSKTQNLSYPTDGNDACFIIEDNSFWFRHRNECITSIIKLYPPIDNGTIFDIGGGNGCVSLALKDSGFDVALVEPGKTGASNAKRRGLDKVICATTNTAKFKPKTLSSIGLFDVIEHIEDDLTFLKSLQEIMKPGGRLYVTVPAYSFLWSFEDIMAGHYRRYTRKRICNVIENAGFEIEFSSYIFRFLPIPIAFFRAFPYRIGLKLQKNTPQAAARDHASHHSVISRILAFVLNTEIKNLRKNKKMNFGGSCLIVAKK